MAATIQKKTFNSRRKCGCCGESIRACEPVFIVVDDATGKARRGELYCEHCNGQGYPQRNNEDIGEPREFYDEERGLRAREDYASYLHEGCVDHYWTDRDAGYCN